MPGAVRDALFACVRYRYEIAAFIVPFAIFTASISGEPGAWDTAEMQGVPYILGIAHPTGFPLYTLLGYLFSHVFFAGTIALRLNLFAAICVSIACVAAYRTARLLDVPKMCALAAALWFAVGGIVWTHAIRAEAHDLALACSTISVLYFVRWQKAGQDRDLLLAATGLGLALATHPIAVWLVPGAVLVCCMRRPNSQTLTRAALILAACLSLYLYLPLRSAIVHLERLDPASSLAGLHGGVFWNYNDPSTWHGLLTELSGSQFGAGGTLLSAFSIVTLQMHLWNLMTVLNGAYGAFGIVLAFIGLARVWSMNWKTTLALLVFTLAAVPFSFAYSVEGDADRYRMLSLWLVPILMSGSAIAGGNVLRFGSVVRAAVVCAAMLFWGAETLGNNASLFENRNATGGRQLINEVAIHVPPHSVVVTAWLDATSLAYGSYVDGSLKDRTIVAGWPSEFTRYYNLWSARQPVYVISDTKPVLPGINLSRPAVLDGSHSVWRIVKGAQ
jgi:4-amino-4-deoxy-L-arabinose transferase-like glycosyltransferase